MDFQDGAQGHGQWSCRRQHQTIYNNQRHGGRHSKRIAGLKDLSGLSWTLKAPLSHFRCSVPSKLLHRRSWGWWLLRQAIQAKQKKQQYSWLIGFEARQSSERKQGGNVRAWHSCNSRLFIGFLCYPNFSEHATWKNSYYALNFLLQDCQKVQGY